MMQAEKICEYLFAEHQDLFSICVISAGRNRDAIRKAKFKLQESLDFTYSSGRRLNEAISRL